MLSNTVVAVGADAGGAPRVTLFDRSSGAVVRDFMAYDSSFTGGVRVALADVNGDGIADLITAPGPGGAPHIKVFDGASGALVQSFLAFDAGFTGGVNVAAGDVNGDGKADIIVGAGAGGSPHVKAFDGATGAVLQSFFAFDTSFTGGVNVAAGDVNGDGRADIVVGAGAGGAPHVKVFDGATGQLSRSFFAYALGFSGGVSVAAADLTADGKAEVITGAGPGGAPHVKIFDGASGNLLDSFFAYDVGFAGGVRVGAFTLDSTGRPGIVTAPGAGGSTEVHIFNAPGGKPASLFDVFESGFTGGAFVAGAGLPSALTALSDGQLGDFFQPPSADANVLLTLQLDPLNINLLGLQVQTSPITITVSVDTGSGLLLGNLLTVVSRLINLQGVNNALNNVLGSVVNLLNSASLTVTANTTSGPLVTPPTAAATTPILNLFVAPVHLNLLGVRVDTSPITLALTANSGQGQVLGNALTALANLFNPPLPSQLTVDDINARLEDLLNQLNVQLPGIGSSSTTTTTLSSDTSQVLQLTVPPINLNLLGLVLQTTQIQVNADAQTGNGDLLGNVLTTLLNTLGATPANLATLSNNLSAILGKVVGLLNASSLLLAPDAVNLLAPVLQNLALPNLVSSATTDTVPVLNLAIASTDGTTPPVDVNLLGLVVTTSNIQARLLAQKGDGEILGNLVYNVAHLLDPGGSLNLLSILDQLGV